MRMRIGCVDLVSNTCFPALAAEELGFFKAEGLEARVELVRTPAAFPSLRDGGLDAVAGNAHAILRWFPRWEGAKLVVALAQGTPWLLVVRADLAAQRGDTLALKGLRLTAAPGPAPALRQLLIEAGLDPERDVEMVPVPGSDEPAISFGVFAAKALEAGQVDGFWANAMGSELAVQRGVGKVLLDVRRGDGPPEARRFSFAGLLVTDRLIARDPERVAKSVGAIVKTQQALRVDPTRALEAGQRRFPPDAAALIATLVERDLPFYNPEISREAVAALNRFTQAVGLLPAPVPYDQVVAVQFRDLWES